MNLTIHTLRYYDREGLIPFVERTASGTRVFKDSDLDLLKIIQCLKSSGMTIKDIKQFIQWCSDGDASLQQRYDLFMKQKDVVETQMEELKKTLGVIEHKCQYYRTALDAGTEDVHKNNKIGNTVFE
ncbi:MerR family transcriptional regulator [Bacillus sp. J14TS2]|nr:MerR family transcriptional regulator [Bacillus sp. J14TS2]